jgi:hypothetical protein
VLRYRCFEGHDESPFSSLSSISFTLRMNMRFP